ncbi:MAG TPA: hypothetical protein VLN58_02040 [Verrucomicrobiae bacterium]|nr:hypothetical protein [Verrucomicrobiae bacterium]
MPDTTPIPTLDYTLNLSAEEVIMLNLAVAKKRDYYADNVANFTDDDGHTTPLFWKERLETAEALLEKIRRM